MHEIRIIHSFGHRSSWINPNGLRGGVHLGFIVTSLDQVQQFCLLRNKLSLFFSRIFNRVKRVSAVLSILLVSIAHHSPPSLVDASLQRCPSVQHVVQRLLLRVKDLLDSLTPSVNLLLLSVTLEVELLLFQRWLLGLIGRERRLALTIVNLSLQLSGTPLGRCDMTRHVGDEDDERQTNDAEVHELHVSTLPQPTAF